MPEQNLTFNITNYAAFQNVRGIIKEPCILLNPYKEHKKVFLNVFFIEFWNGKSLKYYLVRATLPILNQSGRCEPYENKTCLVCDSLSNTTTFTTEACQEAFKIQSCTAWKCPYSELFWCVFFRIWTEYGEILRISSYSVQMRENTYQNNSE